VGELNPKFAPASSVVTLTCYGKGWCDLAGEGRAVRNVSEIDVFQAVPSVHDNDPTLPFTHFYSSQIIVSGEGITPKNYDLADLQAMKQQTFDASSSTTNTVGDWTGPTLASVLKASGIDTSDMDSYVVVQATDSYAAVLSMYEATHMTGPQYALLAIQDTLGNTINCGTSCGKMGENGLARLILPNDSVAGRWVSNVSQIVVHKTRPKETCMAPGNDK
jgi:DMSO/TMAO reductase YedYZ molybdopterin-dependent catalytic subunit